MKKELKYNVNTLLWLMVTLSAMIMLSLFCFSSCKSSVNSDQTSKIDQGGKDPDHDDHKDDTTKTVKITVIPPKEGGSIKVNGEVLKEKKELTPNIGDILTFEAVLSDGYKFKEWIPKKLGNKETFELTVSEDTSKEIGLFVKVMTIHEFLEYKIGFNKNSDIVYGKDVSQEQLRIEAENKANGKEYAIYTADSLGFGKTESGKICYHGYNSKKDSIVSMTVEEELNNENQNGNGENLRKFGITENFKSIHDGLEKRWKAMHESTLADGNLYYYDASKAYNSVARKLISTIGGSYDFSLGSDYRLYMKANSASQYSYYMDLRIAFVQKDTPNKGYSVHFCHVNDKNECEPYVLHRTGNSKYKEYPPVAEPEYKEDKEEDMHMFELSSLLKTSLENLHKKESKEWKYSEQELATFLLDKVKKEQYDIYIIFGCTSNDLEKEYFNSFATAIGTYWLNVLKFGDSFWKTLEE